MNINVKKMKKPELSDEEVRSHMHFEQLIEMYKSSTPKRFIQWKYIVCFSVVSLVTATAIYFFILKEDKVQKEQNHLQEKIITDSSKVLKENNQSVEATEEKQNAVLSQEKKKQIEHVEQKSKQNEITTSAFIEAEPVNGYPALYNYFDHELKYPYEAMRDSIEGIVTVSFNINSQGKPEQIKIENSLGQVFDKECTRVVNAMPVWKPATLNGKPISTKLSIALTFKMKK